MTLTAATIRELDPGETVHDTKVRGLHVRATGKSKAFYLWYRTRGGIQRRPKVGDYPAMTIDEARNIARDWLVVVAGGGDPVAEWRVERGAPTVTELAKKYQERHAAQKKTGDQDRRMWDNYILRRIGGRRVADVTRLDIESVHHALRATPYQANRVLSLLSKAFSLAEAWQMRPQNSNPCHGIPRYREAKRRRYLKPGEAGAVYTALKRHAETRPQSVAFLTLLLFTGARPSEIAAARWTDIEGNKITLETHKTDKTGVPRVIFLSPQAVEVLSLLPRTNGTICGIQSPRALWREIVAETGLENIRMYDLRHSFASAGLAGDLTLGQIGELLGHRSTQTTMRYAHLMEERGVEQATRAADVLSAMASVRPSHDEKDERPSQSENEPGVAR